MKNDTQHLDYLISQYVDGCLDTGSKKSLEQKLVNDPTARQLYKEQRDVQDVLDDWGNRIPMINWDEFDQKLAKRLETETVGGGQTSVFRRFARPISAAAALLIAVGVGYGWRAMSITSQNGTGVVVEGPGTPTVAPVAVSIEGNGNDRGSRSAFVHFPEAMASDSQGPRTVVSVISPEDILATKSMGEAVAYGFGPQRLPSTVAVNLPPEKKSEKEEVGPAYP
jgi:hypothetical protein